MPEVAYLPNSEIDLCMEEALEDSKLWREPPEIFEVDRFIEKYLGCELDLSAPLSDGILGEFEFIRGEPPRVKINGSLTEEADDETQPWKEGRWRMTVAHEGAHVLMHLPLFLNQSVQNGLWDEAEVLIYRCYGEGNGGIKERFSEDEIAAEKNDVVKKYGWNSGLLVNDTPMRQRMEFQANRGGAALLMPATRFREDARRACRNINKRRPDMTRDARFQWVVEKLATRYTVSRQAARIRCDQLEIAKHLDNLTLF